MSRAPSRPIVRWLNPYPVYEKDEKLGKKRCGSEPIDVEEQQGSIAAMCCFTHGPSGSDLVCYYVYS